MYPVSFAWNGNVSTNKLTCFMKWSIICCFLSQWITYLCHLVLRIHRIKGFLEWELLRQQAEFSIITEAVNETRIKLFCWIKLGWTIILKLKMMFLTWQTYILQRSIYLDPVFSSSLIHCYVTCTCYFTKRSLSRLWSFTISKWTTIYFLTHHVWSCSLSQGYLCHVIFMIRSHFVSAICTCQLSLMVIVVLGIHMPLTWFLFYIFAIYTAEKINFPIKDFFSKCDQIHRKLQIWSHLLKKSLMKKFIFCAVIPYNHFSGPYFPTFGPNKEIYPVNLCIQSKCRKIRTTKALNTDILYAEV